MRINQCNVGTCRFFYSSKASWRLVGFDMDGVYSCLQRLQVHSYLQFPQQRGELWAACTVRYQRNMHLYTRQSSNVFIIFAFGCMT